MDEQEKKSLTPEQESLPDEKEYVRPDRSELTAMENLYEHFHRVPLKYLDIFIGLAIAALVIVVLVGVFTGTKLGI